MTPEQFAKALGYSHKQRIYEKEKGQITITRRDEIIIKSLKV